MEERIDHFQDHTFPYYKSLLGKEFFSADAVEIYFLDIYKSELEVLDRCLKKVENNDYLLFDRTAHEEEKFRKERLALRKEEL